MSQAAAGVNPNGWCRGKDIHDGTRASRRCYLRRAAANTATQERPSTDGTMAPYGGGVWAGKARSRSVLRKMVCTVSENSFRTRPLRTI